MTEPFSRGIDPKVADKRVKELGVLLIQTYISPTKADSDQAKGRVCRQDDNGSYALIIDISPFKEPINEVDYFKFTNSEICELEATIKITDDNKRKKEVIRILETIRSNSHEAAFNEAIARVKENSKSHVEGQKFIDQLKKINEDEKSHKAVLDYILSMNKCILTTNESDADVYRLVICIDLTESMNPFINQVIEAVGYVVNETKAELDFHGIEEGFEINIVAYRNYDKGFENLIAFTGFKGPEKYEELQKFLKDAEEKTVPCDNSISQKRDYGEAVEAALAYVNSLQCNAVMILGDAPPMDETPVKDLRAVQGEAYWSKLDYEWIRKPTTYLEQTKTLQDKKTPIHTACIETDARSPDEHFEKMSKDTGGKCFKISSTGTAVNEMRIFGGKIASFIARELLEGVNTQFKSVGQAADGIGYRHWT
eukprot:TRINITY_DN5_c3_g1_i1.p1 TRINITY_DN5_c3_g1~~TRINITY_DN5_c3_g1_i1.p1  ORF type:complete len:425 (+),score=69.38 TRINITY_DN5_c3_g1_i1:2-1276(+)